MQRIAIVLGLIAAALYVSGVRLFVTPSPPVAESRVNSAEAGSAQAKYDEANRIMMMPGAALTDIEKAIALYGDVLTQWTRSNEPAGWAYAQINLATAIASLDERAGGADTAKLEEAVAHYRQGLEVITRDKSAVEWANAKSALGLTLHTIGVRRGDKVQLQEAIAMHRSAMEAMSSGTPSRIGVMLNLCDSLAVLGEMSGEAERLREAVVACGEVATTQTRDVAPAMWSAAQMNLANALANLGKSAQGTAELEKALEIQRAVLSEPAIDPAHAIGGKQNLCDTLTTLGEREKSVGRLTEAVAACRAALQSASEGQAFLMVGGDAKARLARAEALLQERHRDNASANKKAKKK